MSPLGLGGWSLAGSLGRVSRARSRRTIDHALDRGVTLIDTAPVYNHSEELLGEALEGRRERVFLATKVGPEDLSGVGIRQSVERSLQRLRTDRLDLLCVHRWREGANHDEVCEALAALIAQGKVVRAGISEPDPGLVARLAERLPGLVVQWRYNAFYRESEAELLPLCRRLGLGYLAFSPLSLGLLSGKFAPDHRFGADDHRLNDPDFRHPRFGHFVSASLRFKELATRRGISPVQLAVAWVLHRPEISCCLTGPKTPDQLDDYLAGLEISLDADLVGEVEAIHTELRGGLERAGATPLPTRAAQPGRFAGKVVLITGAGGGLGAESAVAFAREGARVVIADINPFAARETLERVFEHGDESRWVWCDVLKDGDLERLVAIAMRDYGRIDVLLNNAGNAFFTGREIDQHDAFEWGQMLGINIRQTFVITRAVLPHMLERGDGVIINVASIFGVVGGADLGYDASKGGLPAFTRHLAVEYGSRGIRANCVAPGHVITRRTAAYHDAHDLSNAYPAGYLGNDIDITNAYLFLASDAGRWINGATLPVDGGYVAR